LGHCWEEPSPRGPPSTSTSGLEGGFLAHAVGVEVEIKFLVVSKGKPRGIVRGENPFQNGHARLLWSK